MVNRVPLLACPAVRNREKRNSAGQASSGTLILLEALRYPTMKIAVLLLLFAISLAAGCSSSAPSPQYDSQKAGETLFRALDAWKQNSTGTLAKGNPPLRFEDEDQRAGYRLVEYRLENPQQILCPLADIRVKLSLLDPRGKPVEKTVAYQVVLEPTLAVLRND
jgi:hypothetical protein